MVKNNKSESTPDKSSDLNEIQAEFDAIQQHLKNIVNAGGHLLKEQSTITAAKPVKALEKQIQKNPIAMVLGAFVGGAILGRVFKSCRKKR